MEFQSRCLTTKAELLLPARGSLSSSSSPNADGLDGSAQQQQRPLVVAGQGATTFVLEHIQQLQFHGAEGRPQSSRAVARNRSVINPVVSVVFDIRKQ